jgi:hypothetical protein
MDVPYSQNTSNAYTDSFTETYLGSENYEQFGLQMSDDVLDKMLIRALDDNVNYWNQSPWKIQETDKENVSFLLGEQLDNREYFVGEDKGVDNQLFTAIRAILSYATGQTATPEIVPSRSDAQYLTMARSIQQALYQHSINDNASEKFRVAALNFLTRKRAYLMLRYDPFKGEYGDIVTEVINPEDIIIDRFARYGENPNIIYRRVRATIEEMCARFPKKADEIRTAYSIKRGTFNQMTKMATYFEGWFTYTDQKTGRPKEGLACFVPEYHLILDKRPNPNWIYEKDIKKELDTNVMTFPPKPFVWFNFINLGHSFIDETSLFDQAKPQQQMLNRRVNQFNRNVDLANGRWVASRKAFTQADANKFVNKGAKTVAIVDAEDVTKAIAAITPNNVSAQVYQSIEDIRNEINVIMGTPQIFKGENPSKSDGTLGRDLIQKQQAGMLQDDFVRAIMTSWQQYYQIKLQLMRVFYTDDYWFATKGGDGKFDFVMLNGDNIDANVKIGVQVDSTLPLDKESIRATALQLSQKSNVGIDMLTLMEDLGLPDPEIRTERFLRSQMDGYTYMQSIEQQMQNNDAEADIDLLLQNKVPEERDDYNADYLNYFNDFVTKNRFTMLNQKQKQAIIKFLQIVQLKAQRTAQLQTPLLTDAGIIDRPPIFPLPKRTENIRIDAMASPQDTHAIAAGEGQMFQPIAPAQAQQQALSNGQAQAAPSIQQGTSQSQAGSGV